MTDTPASTGTINYNPKFLHGTHAERVAHWTAKYPEVTFELLPSTDPSEDFGWPVIRYSGPDDAVEAFLDDLDPDRFKGVY